MPTSSRHAYPSPASTAAPDVPVDIKALADAVDLKTPYVSTSTPTATSGLIWRHPTTGVVGMGDGSSFFPVSTGQITGIKRRTTSATATSGTTEVSVLDHTFNMLASSAYKLEFHGPWTPDNVGDFFIFRIRKTNIAGAVLSQKTTEKVEGIVPYATGFSFPYITTSAEATAVFHVTAARLGGAGTCRVDGGAYLMATYLGPSSQVASV
jgi:hypothetical protein